jgi:hypothetical protein
MSAAVLPPPVVANLPTVLDRLGPSWTRLDHLPFGAAVDVEHVLLSTSGVAVVTTPATVPRSQHPATEARWRARKVTALLGQVAWVPALPVLVVPATGDVGCCMREGVLVSCPDDVVSRLAHPDVRPAPLTASITPAQVGAMVDVLLRHAARTERVVAGHRAR